MAFSWEARGGTHRQLKWTDFTADMENSQAERSTADIVKCLRLLLERFEESEFIKYLVAPSPSSLALFFKIPIQQIYQALKDLEQQGYETETSSHYAPIILWDPLIRERTSQSRDTHGASHLPSF